MYIHISLGKSIIYSVLTHSSISQLMCHSALGLKVNKISYCHYARCSICLHSLVCFHSSIKQYRNISTILSLKKSLICLTMNRLVTQCPHSNVLILNDMFKTTFANLCVNNVCKSVVIKVDNTYISNSFFGKIWSFLSVRQERFS